MRVLVTGGAGYIGSVSVRFLLDRGHEVVVLDTLERGHAEAVDPRARLVTGDVGDGAALGEALPGVDAVLHCAGYIEVGESLREPERFRDNNVERPKALLDAMRERGISALVFSSSAAVYGEPAEVPILEDATCAPISVYGETKLAFEQLLAERGADGLRAVSLRYFNAAGASRDGSLGEAHDPETHIVPRVLAIAAAGGGTFEVFGGDYPTSDGTCVRDYIHVLDLAQAHILGLERLAAGGDGGVFNLGNSRGYSNLEVVRTCAEVTGIAIEAAVGPRREGDPAALIASSERARDVLGWTPGRAELRTMVEDAWRWHRTHPHGFV